MFGTEADHDVCVYLFSICFRSLVTAVSPRLLRSLVLTSFINVATDKLFSFCSTARSYSDRLLLDQPTGIGFCECRFLSFLQRMAKH